MLPVDCSTHSWSPGHVQVRRVGDTAMTPHFTTPFGPQVIHSIDSGPMLIFGHGVKGQISCGVGTALATKTSEIEERKDLNSIFDQRLIVR